MAAPLLPDDLWQLIEPLLPPHRPRPRGGRPPVGDRRCLTGILFVLKTGIAWEDLPAEMNCGCGMTCWRRLRDWQKAGVWGDLHRVLPASLLASLRDAGGLDLERVAVDSAGLRALKGGRRPARTRPTGRGRAASTT